MQSHNHTVTLLYSITQSHNDTAIVKSRNHTIALLWLTMSQKQCSAITQPHCYCNITQLYHNPPVLPPPIAPFQWTSDNSGTDRSNFDEIDVEFINFRNNVNNPGCLWIHHYKNGASGAETEICPAEAQRLTRLPYLPQPCTAFHTYGLDWQPTYMRWYIDGRLVHSRDFNDRSQVRSQQTSSVTTD